MSGASSASGPLRIGRYALYGEIASGGMGTVHYGRLLGAAGFARAVAIKRLRRDLVRDAEVVAMFIDEARVASHVRHPNVVQTLDVIAHEEELFLVMDYVEGESLSRLAVAARKEHADVPIKIAAAIVCGALEGLHAAHEAKDESGDPLEIVHRDVSPQNILVGIDGTARVADFGIAKAAGRLHVTRDGRQKGKPAYMAPEQLKTGLVDRRVDIYAAGVVLWELLAGERLFKADNDVALVSSVLEGNVAPPSTPRGPEAACLDDVVLRALSLRRTDRFGTAAQMASAITLAAGGVATTAEVGAWVSELAHERVRSRARDVADFDATLTTSTLAPAPEPTASTLAPVPAQTASARAEPSRSRFLAGAVFGAVAVAVTVVGVLVFGRGENAAPVEARPAPAPTPSIAAEPLPANEPAALDLPATPPRRIPRTAPTSRKALATPAGKCLVRSFVDDGGVKHFFEDCPK